MKEIKLSRGYVALVDDADFEALNKFGWFAVSAGKSEKVYPARYVKENGKRIMKTMHRFILPSPKGKQIDHIDGDKLNNQRSNLRVCTSAQNQWNRGRQKNNSSGHKGVSWNKTSKKWRVQLRANGKVMYCKEFKEKTDACNAYVAACNKYHGEYAKY